MLILSAHKDLVKNNYKFSYDKGVFKGLLDNYIGRMILDSLLIDEPSLYELSKQGKIKSFYNNYEEWALTIDFPTLTSDDIVIVVDVASGKSYDGYDFGLENISGFTKDEIDNFQGNLIWEGFNPLTREYDGSEDDADEAFQWVKLGHKVISFIIPIQNGNQKTGWHVDDCTIDTPTLVKCKQGLKRLINFLS
jgi:hypothetical protein